MTSGNFNKLAAMEVMVMNKELRKFLARQDTRDNKPGNQINILIIIIGVVM